MKAEQLLQETSRPHLTVVKNPTLLPEGKPEGQQPRDQGQTSPKMLMPEQPTGYIRCKEHDCL